MSSKRHPICAVLGDVTEALLRITASAVELRFDATGSPSLSDEVRARAIRPACQRATKEGVIVSAPPA